MSARLTDKEYDQLMADSKVREAMRLRCEEQGHDWQNALGFTADIRFRVYQVCKWCRERR